MICFVSVTGRRCETCARALESRSLAGRAERVIMTDATQDASLTASQTLSQTQRTKSPTYTRGAETSAGCTHAHSRQSALPAPRGFPANLLRISDSCLSLFLMLSCVCARTRVGACVAFFLGRRGALDGRWSRDHRPCVATCAILHGFLTLRFGEPRSQATARGHFALGWQRLRSDTGMPGQ